MNIFLALSFLFSGSVFAKSVEQIVDEVVSVFENSTPVIQYCAIEDIHDGRGYTAGKAGFTTATGDLILVVKEYPHQELFQNLIPLLEERAKDEDPSVEGLATLPELWKTACFDPEFLKTQDLVVDKLYKTPAREAMKKFGIKTQLGYLIFYDTMIQHGDGNDPDGFYGIIQKMPSLPSREEAFLKLFLAQRLKVLQHASNPDTRDVWRESVDRVHALNRLLKQAKFELNLPLKIHVWDEDFEL